MPEVRFERQVLVSMMHLPRHVVLCPLGVSLEVEMQTSWTSKYILFGYSGDARNAIALVAA